MTIRLVVVDDHPLFREGVTRSLTDLGFAIVGEGCTRDDAISLAGLHQPDILLADISMPGGGLEVIRPILAQNALQKIVLLTVSESTDDAVNAMNLGAKGYVLKGISARSLGEVLASVAGGETYVAPTLAARMLGDLNRMVDSQGSKHPLDRLTERENQILKLVSEGMSNKHVALRLDLQEKTVKYHMTRVMSKLEVRNRTAAAMLLRTGKAGPAAAV